MRVRIEICLDLPDARDKQTTENKRGKVWWGWRRLCNLSKFLSTRTVYFNVDVIFTPGLSFYHGTWEVSTSRNSWRKGATTSHWNSSIWYWSLIVYTNRLIYDDSVSISFCHVTICLSSVQHIYASYGWYILGAAILLVYAWSKVKPHYEKWRKRKEEEEYAAQIHKSLYHQQFYIFYPAVIFLTKGSYFSDPDLFRARQEAITAARLRMQEEHDQQAKLKAERAKEVKHLYLCTPWTAVQHYNLSWSLVLLSPFS